MEPQQNASKRFREDDDKCGSGVLLALPANTVIPSWYQEQTDAAIVSTALQAGAAAMKQASASTVSETFNSMLDSALRSRLSEKDALIAELKRGVPSASELTAALSSLKDSQLASLSTMKEIFDSTRLQRANAQQKGQEGDGGAACHKYALIAMLSKAFGAAKGCSLEDVSKTTSAGDIRMLYCGLNIMWEAYAAQHAKAHEQKAQKGVAAIARNIPTDEVVKLKNNVKEKGADIGIIVGLYAGIANHSANVIDIEEGAETIIFINRLMLAEDPVAILQTLIPIFQVFAKRKQQMADGGICESKTSKQLESILTLMNAQITKFEARRKNLESIRKTFATFFDGLNADLKSFEAEHKAAIDAISSIAEI